MNDLRFLSDWSSKTNRSLQLLRSVVHLPKQKKCLNLLFLLLVCVCVCKTLIDIQTNHRDIGVGRGGSEGASVASTFVGRVDVHPSKKHWIKLFRHKNGNPICGLFGDSVHTFLCFLSPCLFWTSGESISYAARFPSSQIVKREN